MNAIDLNWRHVCAVIEIQSTCGALRRDLRGIPMTPEQRHLIECRTGQIMSLARSAQGQNAAAYAAGRASLRKGEIA